MLLEILIAIVTTLTGSEDPCPDYMVHTQDDPNSAEIVIGFQLRDDCAFPVIDVWERHEVDAACWAHLKDSEQDGPVAHSAHPPGCPDHYGMSSEPRR